jgi:hypothetical protein
MEHLQFVDRTCRKLARSLVHTMGKYREKLEYEQLILANFVEIGVDLFAMSASLAYAEYLVGQNPGDQSPQELADLYCANARDRIAANFRAVKRNHNHQFSAVTNALMEGNYGWLSTDIFEDYVAKAASRELGLAHTYEEEHAHVK